MPYTYPTLPREDVAWPTAVALVLDELDHGFPGETHHFDQMADLEMYTVQRDGFISAQMVA